METRISSASDLEEGASVIESGVDVNQLTLVSSNPRFDVGDLEVLSRVRGLQVGNLSSRVSTSLSQCVSNGLEPGIELSLQLVLESGKVDRVRRATDVGSPIRTTIANSRGDMLRGDLPSSLEDPDVGEYHVLLTRGIRRQRSLRATRSLTSQHLKSSGSDGLVIVDREYDRIDTVQRGVSGADGQLLVSGILHPTAVQPGLAGSNIDCHLIGPGTNQEVIADIREHTIRDDPVEQGAELLSVVYPVSVN